MISNTKLSGSLNQLFLKNNIKTIFRLQNQNSWLKIFDQLSFSPFVYSNSFINYICEYEKSINYFFIDLSVIIYQDNQPIAISPIFIIKNNKDSLMQLNIEMPIFLNEFDNQKKYLKKLFNKFYISISEFSQILSLDNYKIKINFNDKKNAHFWLHEYSKKKIAINLRSEFYIDLAKPIEEINKNIRPNTFSEIKKSEHKFTIKKLTLNDYDKWNEFKKLHLSISKKKTRSDESWDIQFNNIKNNYALFLYINDSNNELISGCFFDYTKDEANYSVSVHSNYAKENYLNALILYESIKVFKNKKIKYLRLGFNDFNNNVIGDNKLDNINFFKESFYNKMFILYSLNINLDLNNI